MPRQKKSAATLRMYRGITYDSILEKDCAMMLLTREAAGEISKLIMQPSFFFVINGEPLKTYTGRQKMKYTADFMYDGPQPDGQMAFDKDGMYTYVIDAKGFPRPDFKIRWALVRHMYPNIKFLLWNRKKGYHEH